ncbi:MAG: arsenite methyltransferase [Leptospiraceae bacterium]|nr:arsenite methyltransferase [Leptospiraceae bacterium]MCK6381073.1 arsenite methyltransferase [Leptospiraceae bacterium]NUM42300.1 arsenite methyltransferase [Leptospiraceae bacterium]
MQTTESIKEMVKEKYATIANQSKDHNAFSCCGTGGCSTVDYSIFSEDYSKLKGYESDADLGLGCGLPTQFANIKKGDIVIDLGSGAGNDAFIARTIVEEEGQVIGVDMTLAMIEKARANSQKLGFKNVEFKLGEIEKIPIESEKADVVISNCVLNLVPDKNKAFSEIYRILKPGGQFCISDIVLSGQLPENLKDTTDMYTGCISGAVQKKDYLNFIYENGFENVSIKKEKVIQIPDDILNQYLTPKEVQTLKDSGTRILSVTVFAKKSKLKSCCGGNGHC